MSRVAPAFLAAILPASAIPVESQAGRQVRVALEFQQQGQDSREGARGRASGVIIQASSESSFILTATVQ